MAKRVKTEKLSIKQIEKLRDLEPDALPLGIDKEEILDEIPDEDEFDTPQEEKPVPGEGP